MGIRPHFAERSFALAAPGARARESRAAFVALDVSGISAPKRAALRPATTEGVPMSSRPTDDQYLFVTLDRLSCLAEIGVRLAEIVERGALAGAVSNPSVGRESRFGPRDPLTRVEP